MSLIFILFFRWLSKAVKDNDEMSKGADSQAEFMIDTVVKTLNMYQIQFNFSSWRPLPIMQNDGCVRLVPFDFCIVISK